MAKRGPIYGAVGLVVVAAAVVAIVAATAGAGGPAGAAAQAASVNSIVSQVQAAFGDSQIASASPAGGLLTVKLSAADPAQAMIGTFEAQVLAHAVAAYEQGSGQAPISSVTYVDSGGNSVTGGTDDVGALPAAAPLSSDACQVASNAAPNAVTVASARTLPLVGGTCVIKLQPASPSAFLADASSQLGGITSMIPDQADHPYIYEVDDQSGTPVMILAWVPALGGTNVQGQGSGEVWLKPGLCSDVVAPISTASC